MSERKHNTDAEFTAEGIAVVPEQLRSLEEACHDVAEIFGGTGKKYIVAGSIAALNAAGDLYRTPKDIDVWYDAADREEIAEAFQAKGYTHNITESEHLASLDVFEKGNASIDLRRSSFTDRGIEYYFQAPIPAVPIRHRPQLTFRYPNAMVSPVRYRFGDSRFLGLSRESSWLNILIARAMRGETVEQDAKRQVDLERLERGMNTDRVQQILDERPGVYFNDLPLVTFSSIPSLRLTNVATRDIRRILQNFR